MPTYTPSPEAPKMTPAAVLHVTGITVNLYQHGPDRESWRPERTASINISLQARATGPDGEIIQASGSATAAVSTYPDRRDPIDLPTVLHINTWGTPEEVAVFGQAVETQLPGIDDPAALLSLPQIANSWSSREPNAEELAERTAAVADWTAAVEYAEAFKVTAAYTASHPIPEPEPEQQDPDGIDIELPAVIES